MRLITSARKLYHDNNFDEQEGSSHICTRTGTSHLYSMCLICCGKVLHLLVDNLAYDTKEMIRLLVHDIRFICCAHRLISLVAVFV